MTIEILKVVDMEMSKIHPNAWNPNEQTEDIFNMLNEEIVEDGFDHPINLVDCTCDLMPGPHYMIIGGEHRWRVMRLHDNLTIPAVVNKNWDEQAQKLKTVRRNLLGGDMNPQKFTALVKSLEDRIDAKNLPRLFGFTEEAEYRRYLIKDDEGKKDKTFMDGLLTEAKTEKFAVDSITDIVASIFKDAGSTVDQNYLFFAYRGKLQTVILCDGPAFAAVKGMIEELKSSGKTATEFITAAINEHLG